MKKAAIILLTQVLFAFSLQAHSLWIHSPANGEIGKVQQVKIYFGVFHEDVFEKIGAPDSRWPEVDKFSSWVISPSGKKIPLQFKENGNHYLSSFVPEEKGTFVIVLENKVREVADWTDTESKIGIVKQNFYSRTTTQIGGNHKASDTAVTDLTILKEPEANTGNQVGLKVIFKGKPVKGVSLTIRYSGAKDRKITTDENGNAAFIADKPGEYFVLGLLRFETPGTFNGVKYDAIREKATMTFAVN